MLILDTINTALERIAVKNPIDEASPQDHSTALRVLNGIIDLYNTQGLLITHLQEFVIEPPYEENQCDDNRGPSLARRWKNAITIGPCKDIDMQAPISIDSLFWRNGETDYMSILMSEKQWSDNMIKNDTTIPRRHYVQRIDDNNLKVYFDFIPQEGLELHFMGKLPYTGKNANDDEYIPTDDIKWSRGFEKMLQLRLAVELCDFYEKTPSKTLMVLADEAERAVKVTNFVPQTLNSDVARLGTRRSFSGNFWTRG